MIAETKISINLESLLSLGARLNETNDENVILGMALLSLMGKLKIFRGIVFIPDESGKYFVVSQFKGKKTLEIIRAFNIGNNGLMDNKKELSEAGYEICIPVKYREELLAMICLSRKIDSKKLSDEEFYYTSLVSSITANALKNAGNIKLLINEKALVEQRNQLLTTLFEVSRDFNIFLTRDKIIKTMTYNLLGQLMITKFAVIYFDEEFRNNNIDNHKNNDKQPVIIKNTFKESPPLGELNEIRFYKKSSYTQNLDLSPKLRDWCEENKVIIFSPMVIQGETKGCMFIGRKSGGIEFTEENLLFIDVIGNTSVLAIKNLKMIEMEVERQKLENELSIALEIQKKLLPKDVPGIKGFDIFGFSKPSRFVGGDYYDYIHLPNGNLLIAIADVSGKGIPAALLMANVQAVLRVLAPLSLSLEIMINHINNVVYQNTGPDRFVTFFFGELNPENGDFKYINAGHNPPFIINKDGSIKFLTNGGIILGILEKEINYNSGYEKIQNEDLIVLYTDGVTEALNSSFEEFGEKKLLSFLHEFSGFNSSEIANIILEKIVIHSSGMPQHDDITMVVIKKLKN
jgi:phosphoserine phosphatase RsbU/P